MKGTPLLNARKIGSQTHSFPLSSDSYYEDLLRLTDDFAELRMESIFKIVFDRAGSRKLSSSRDFQVSVLPLRAHHIPVETSHVLAGRHAHALPQRTI